MRWPLDRFGSALLLSTVFGLCIVDWHSAFGEIRLPRGYAAYKVGDRPPGGRVGDSRLAPPNYVFGPAFWTAGNGSRNEDGTPP